MPEPVNRGFVPGDANEFGDAVLPTLRYAQQDIVYLLGRGYELTHAVTFVGNRFQLSARQRTALTRASSEAVVVAARKQRQTDSLAGSTVYIDGFNLIITLEAAQSPETTLLGCMDGTVRDLCGLHGTYRLIEATATALNWTAESLVNLKVAQAVFYLDAPVSNSGRLRTAILEVMGRHSLPCEVLLVPNADRELWDKSPVITTDAIILERCSSWVNLAASIISDKLPERRIVRLDCNI